MSKSKGCPFCGATPHHGLGKVQHCQLHGEPFQDFSIWCPRGHAKITERTEERAWEMWETRPDELERLSAPTDVADRYFIIKSGAYYRPNAEGYTRDSAEAGRFTLDEAISHSHPNGPDGPRDGIDYVPVPKATDVADRREAIARSVYEKIRSWGDPVEIWDDLHPNDRAIIASLIAGPPEGFVVVPAEPTEAMLAAWATSDKYKDDWRKDCAVGWSAMIAARPTGES